jgi:hypothetical protein
MCVNRGLASYGFSTRQWSDEYCYQIYIYILSKISIDTVKMPEGFQQFVKKKNKNQESSMLRWLPAVERGQASSGLELLVMNYKLRI